MRTTKLFAFMIGLLAVQWGCTSQPGKVSFESRDEPLMVFLVRHGEKVDQSRDPELSIAGEIRADVLATTLLNAHIEYIHSSDYIRTRNTVAPIAKTLGLKVELYDPDNLPALVDRLIDQRGRHLVVGHSSTTLRMVELLGGGYYPPIDGADEYDRLYIVTIGPDGEVSSVQLSYGASYLKK